MSGFNYSGFQMNQKRHNAVPPPPMSGVSKQGYSTMNAISQNALSAAWGGSRKRAATEDEYFEDDEEETVPDLAYIPAPGSPTRVETKKQEVPNDDDDPLDAYMAGIEKQMKSEKPGSSSQPTGVRNDLEEEDVEESYYRYMEENPNAGLAPVEEELDLEYDEDGNPIPPDKKKIIDPLPPIDHSTIEYKPFEKNFYNEHPEIASLSNKQVAELRKTFDITVSGTHPPKPVSSFAHFNFDDKLLKAIIKAEYTSPTPIQAQAVPCALQGRDVLGIAQTGSGKTAAFLWPLLKHVSTQPPVTAGEGPAALILAPTRELAIQIYNEAKKFARVYDLTVVCAYGGGSKWEQSLALKEGADIVVATPGRIIDHVKGGATNLQRVTFLVLDEADRMFELGFEPQVRSVCNHVRPDRQTLLFSATFRKRIEKLAKDALNDPVRISQGITGQANEDVTQRVLLMENQQLKRDWLVNNLVELLSAGSVLVFVTKKVDAEQLANDLKVKEFECLLLHGDIEQAERNKVITAFKKKECSLLVATDVAARGLDIPHIRTVVNYDIARDIDTHTHRIGRTGRAGNQGTAYTLITPKDKEFVGHIVKNLEAAHQDVPQEVLDLALQSSWYRKQRYKSKGGNPNVGGVGLGFKEKVGGASKTFVGESHSQSRGPATDRLSAMKAAFKAQYMNQFTASSDPVPQAPPPASTRKKSRWQ
ncbi:ATP-dependent RNA helicase DDX42 [Tribolium castaneum]|uniref:RNA helicase n=1 Tax=Tribolium castaneum TaxID=7070 RepID=D6WV09_TRICA|nr:PREDICTED: ATP-dependent RNA helicase DDX42 [Tribolium castaneum]EFA08520.1 ATP-dependent RNA helicase p62-like Protein [Tribolium castaneum]|eukprot:XP_008196207.1 PREDICTED: ATP-dependent RNA helicase DDX42 [Tribolium castaneum]